MAGTYQMHNNKNYRAATAWHFLLEEWESKVECQTISYLHKQNFTKYLSWVCSVMHCTFYGFGHLYIYLYIYMYLDKHMFCGFG